MTPKPTIGEDRHYVGRQSVRLAVVRQHLLCVTQYLRT